jgi:flagellar basal-body rod protein FlgF
MVNGLYTASKGMINILEKQDINSQNLANANTTGFKMARLINKAEVTVGRDDEGHLRQQENQSLSGLYTSFEQGPMVKTGNNLDIALTAPGFFTVESEEGPRYTRGGSLSMNASGDLVTLNGKRVLDDTGAPISLQGENVQIMDDGVIHVDGKRNCRLGVVDFSDRTKLMYGKEGLFRNADAEGNPPRAPDTIAVKQGFLEGSNVNPIHTMVTLIAEFRNYEADQRALRAIDETLGKAVMEVGRV